MGSFNVGCGLSNLSVGFGDKVGLQLLMTVPTTDSYVEKTHKISSPGQVVVVESEFKPFLPPIFGKYDDYGRIGDIQESTTTKLIETIFQKPIATVLACVENDRSIYYSSGEIFETYASPNDVYTNFSSSTKAKMKSLGFAVTKTEKGQPPVYSFGGYRLESAVRKGWSVFKDGETEALVSGSIADDAEELAAFFATHTNLFPGFPENVHAIIKTLHSMSGMFFLTEVYEKMESFIVQENDFFYSRLDSFEQDWDDFIQTFDLSHTPTTHQYDDPSMATRMDKYHDVETDGVYRRFASGWALNTNRFLSDYTSMPSELADRLHVYKNDYSFKMLANLKIILTAVNRLFQPTALGEQCGNDAASKALVDVTDSILAVRAEDHDDYE